VNGLHVQGVARHESDVLGLAQIGQPVPAEEALAGDHPVIAEGRDGFEKGARLGRHFLVQHDGAGLVEDPQVHGSGMQVDPAVEAVRLVVETHHKVGRPSR
jgi:hypothetical protein